MSDNYVDNPDFADFTITSDDKGWHAKDKKSELSVTVLPDDENHRLYHRRSLKPLCNPPQRNSALVGELGDVRVYIKGSSIVITKQKLQP